MPDGQGSIHDDAGAAVATPAGVLFPRVLKASLEVPVTVKQA